MSDAQGYPGPEPHHPQRRRPWARPTWTSLLSLGILALFLLWYCNPPAPEASNHAPLTAAGLEPCGGYLEGLMAAGSIDAHLSDPGWPLLLQGDALRLASRLPPVPPAQGASRALWLRAWQETATLLDSATLLAEDAALRHAIHRQTARGPLTPETPAEQVGPYAMDLLAGLQTGTLNASQTNALKQLASRPGWEALAKALLVSTQAQQGAADTALTRRASGRHAIVQLLPLLQEALTRETCPFSPAAQERLRVLRQWVESPSELPPPSQWVERLRLNEPTLSASFCVHTQDVTLGLDRFDPVFYAALWTASLLRLARLVPQTPWEGLLVHWAKAQLDPARDTPQLCTQVERLKRTPEEPAGTPPLLHLLALGDSLSGEGLASALGATCAPLPPCLEQDREEPPPDGAARDAGWTPTRRIDAAEAWIQQCGTQLRADPSGDGPQLEALGVLAGPARRWLLGTSSQLERQIEWALTDGSERGTCSALALDEVLQLWAGSIGMAGRWGMPEIRLSQARLMVRQGRQSEAVKPVCDLSLVLPLLRPLCEELRALPPSQGRSAAPPLEH